MDKPTGIKLKLGEKEYELRRPKMGDQIWLSEELKKVKGDDASELLVTVAYLERLGISREVIDDLDPDDFLTALKTAGAKKN